MVSHSPKFQLLKVQVFLVSSNVDVEKFYSSIKFERYCESSRIFENYSNLLEVLWKNRIIFFSLKLRH